MAELQSSNDPTDIATLAYIWGYPMVSQVRTIDYSTSPNVPPALGRGPINTFNNFRTYPTSNFTDIVRLNVDTLYSLGYLDLGKEPLVLQVPPISGRYYTLQFIDAYTNNFLYIGSRLNDTTGGTYLITGPNWKGDVPSDMKEIKSATNNMTIAGRIFVNGPSDLSNVNAIQDKLLLATLSVFGQNSTSSQSKVATETNASKQIPIAPQPALIPTTGIKIYDEISADMADNQSPQADSEVLAKFATIGIGPGLTPSETQNQTIIGALQNGITEGEKLIDEKIQVLGTTINGWSVNLDIGNFGTDYLLRAAVAKWGLGANSPVEAVYPGTFTDNQGQNLTGTRNYVIHFDKGQTPPVNAFWSITLYNNKSYLVENPINRYSIASHTQGLKYNPDGSLDVYIQNASPGTEKESNWLPSPSGEFSLTLREYNPQEPILKGEYQIPPVKLVS
jgi:DNA sulfur modification protein DndE